MYEAVDSPDGKQIAFVSNRDGSGEIYVMEADRTQQRQLTHTSSFNIDPAWSPDGRRIVFSSARDGNPEIYVMNSDGSDQRRLTRDANRDENPVRSLLSPLTRMPDGCAHFVHTRARSFSILRTEAPALRLREWAVLGSNQ